MYEPVDRVLVIGGTLLSTHAMHDGIRDDIWSFRELTEQGLQGRVDLDWLKQDTWIDWRVRESRDGAEEFDVGHVTQLRVAGVHLDAQALWSHVGGQKNSTGRVDNNLSAAFGASWGIGFGSTVEEIRAGVHYLHSNHDTRTGDANGDGLEARVTVDLAVCDAVRARLFGAHFFDGGLVAGRGDRLYSLSRYSQFGGQVVMGAGGGLRIEAGALGQFARDEFMNTYFVNLVWGGSYRLLGGDEPGSSR